VKKGEIEAELPSNVTLDMLWEKLCIIQTKTEENGDKIDDNGEQISTLSKGLLNLTTKIDELEEKENRDVKDITNSLDDMQSCMATIMGRLTRSEITNKRIQDELTDLRSYSMKTNLIISFNKKNVSYKEQPDELSKQVAKRFFAEVMQVPGVDDLYIPVSHRVGPKSARARALLVQLPISTQLNKVMSHAKHLAGTGHFISKQLPPARKERKQFVLPRFKHERLNKDQKVQLVDDKLFINGNLQSQYLPSSIPVISSANSQTDDIAISMSDIVDEGGSIFQGFAAKASSLYDVRRTLDKLLQSPANASATHYMYAYCFDDPELGRIENFESDGDFGLGPEMIKVINDQDITDCMLILTRKCGPNFQHIGNRRFEITIQVCKEALTKL
jgi:hypothetical protein